MYPRVPWVQRITVIKYGNTCNYLKTANISQHAVYIKFYNCNYEFFVANLLSFWQPKGDSMWSSAVYDMYDQLTICILKINFIYLEDYAWPLKPSKHDP